MGRGDAIGNFEEPAMCSCGCELAIAAAQAGLDTKARLDTGSDGQPPLDALRPGRWAVPDTASLQGWLVRLAAQLFRVRSEPR